MLAPGDSLEATEVQDSQRSHKGQQEQNPSAFVAAHTTSSPDSVQ